MRLFNRAKEEASDQANAPATLPGIAPMGSSASPAPPAPPKGGDAAEKGPDTAVLDASVREMSEKIARLSSSLESVNTEKQTFEDKIERMEERMRKLSSLTEMLSSQYNPFVGDAPSERAPLRADAASGASTSMAPPATKSDAAPEPDRRDERVTVVVAEPEPEPAWEEAEAPESDAAEDAPAEDASDADAATPAARAHPPHLERVAPGFQSSMLLLNWSNTLLKAAGSREGLHQVLRYYATLGWVSEEVAESLAAYAEGLACAEDGRERDWRGDVELHERSLLFIEKLKGRTG